MADTRYLGNHVLRVAVALESSNPLGTPPTPEAPTAAQLNGNFDYVSPAIRFNGYGFGMQATQQNEDRSLSDAPGARERGFLQAGGDVPAYVPRDFEASADILAILWRMVRKPGEKLWVATRMDARGDGDPFASLDEVCIYLVEVDGGQHVSEGTTARVYTITWQSAGDIVPNTFVAGSPKVAIAISNGTAATVGSIQARGAFVTVGGKTVELTHGVKWSVDDDTIAQVIDEGPFVLFTSAGTVELTASHPSFTLGTKTITVA